MGLFWVTVCFSAELLAALFVFGCSLRRSRLCTPCNPSSSSTTALQSSKCSVSNVHTHVTLLNLPMVRPTHVVAQSSGRGVSVVYPLPGEERSLGRPFKGRVLRTAVLEIPDPHTFLLLLPNSPQSSNPAGPGVGSGSSVILLLAGCWPGLMISSHLLPFFFSRQSLFGAG